jgi:hypothetical protein
LVGAAKPPPVVDVPPNRPPPPPPLVGAVKPPPVPNKPPEVPAAVVVGKKGYVNNKRKPIYNSVVEKIGINIFWYSRNTKTIKRVR